MSKFVDPELAEPVVDEVYQLVTLQPITREDCLAVLDAVRARVEALPTLRLSDH